MAKRKSVKSSDSANAQGRSYTVLARRYRPQQFADLVGQEHVAQALTNAIQSNRVAHAYLFTGSRGVGKTSTARILAKALNCEKGPTIAPCDKCELCRSIAAGDDVDVLEIDGASNRGIDEVREIRQNVQYRPSRARCKIYIIDEVHMLTPPAFNALLKTLEEPPAHVKFIFATTEIQKIPITILSRCQRFDFAGISIQKIVEQLKKIVDGEERKADEEALALIARRAGGSMRDAESLLDQLLAFDDKKLSADQVHALLGTAHEEHVVALATAAFRQDAKATLALLAQSADAGLDLGELLDQLIDYWRDLMVVHCAGLEGQFVSVSGNHQQTLEQQAQAAPLDSLLAGLDIMTAAKAKLARGARHSRVLVEMAIVRLSRLGDLVALSQLAESLTNAGNIAAPGNQSKPTPPGPERRLPAAAQAKKNDAPTVKDTQSAQNGEYTSEDMASVWPELLAQLPPMLGGQLKRMATAATSGPNTLVIQVSAQYNSQREQWEDSKTSTQIERVLESIVRRPCKVRFDSIKNNGIGELPEAARAHSEGEGAQSRESRTAEIPLIQQLRDVLHATVRSEDPGFGAEAD